MMLKIKYSVITASLLLLSGCIGGSVTQQVCPPNCPATNVNVITTPSPSGIATTATVTPIATTTLTITVTDQTTKAPLPNTDIEISGATFQPQKGKTDANGVLTLPNMRVDTEYNIVINAVHYKPYQDKLGVNQLTRLNTQAGIQLAVALKPATVIAGTIQDSTGKVLADAVVFDGKESYLTDANGQFSMVRTEIGQLNLIVSKQGYQNQTINTSLTTTENLVLETVQLTAKDSALKVLLDGSKRPFNVTNGLSQFTGLTQNLKSSGFEVQSALNPTLPSLEDIDILFIPSPTLQYSESEINAIINFVKAGKKLVVSGEWGGFGGSNIDAINALLLKFNLKMGGDTLREKNTGFLTISQFDTHAITKSLSSLKLYQSSSVEIVTPINHSDILARTSVEGFKIANTTGAFGVLGSALSGNGKVIAIGDSSIWRDEDSDGNGVANLQEADNLKLAQQIFNW